MDEIENVKIIKKMLKLFAILLVTTVILTLIISTLKENIILNAFFTFFVNSFIFIDFFILMILIPMTINICVSSVQNFIKSKINISGNKNYVRNIEIKYSPAIISLILDLNISYYKDYTATILYLCYRKYLELLTENDEIKFKILEENINDLNPHEQYVYRCINGSGFNENKFKQLIIEDSKNLGLITTIDGKIQRTLKGEKEAALWKGFKNYIHDYTLISDKDIRYMVILDEYIPYAIALEEARYIEDFISKNENYRNFIYKFSNTRKT